MRKLVRLFGAGLIAALPALTANAQQRGPDGQPGPADKLAVVVQRAVQRELNLTDKQVQQIQQRVEKSRATLAEIDTSDAKELNKLARANDTAVANIIKGDQLRRLNQIYLQQRGPRTFGDTDVAKQLSFTAAQKSRIKQIEDKAYERIDGVLADLDAANDETFAAGQVPFGGAPGQGLGVAGQPGFAPGQPGFNGPLQGRMGQAQGGFNGPQAAPGFQGQGVQNPRGAQGARQGARPQQAQDGRGGRQQQRGNQAQGGAQDQAARNRQAAQEDQQAANQQIDAIRADADEQLLSLLNAAQQNIWYAMHGESFESRPQRNNNQAGDDQFGGDAQSGSTRGNNRQGGNADQQGNFNALQSDDAAKGFQQDFQPGNRRGGNNQPPNNRQGGGRGQRGGR